MCRRCGEPDRRGSAKQRRARKQALLDMFGDGTTCPCVWCETPLTFATVQQDRLVPGGPYRLDNLVPACGRCNRRRTYERLVIAEGCWFGPVGDTQFPREPVAA